MQLCTIFFTGWYVKNKFFSDIRDEQILIFIKELYLIEQYDALVERFETAEPAGAGGLF